MKEKMSLKKTLPLAIFVMGIFLYKNVSAKEKDPIEAPKCHYTGNSSDYCYTSNGSNNIKVTNCSPGSTDCSYSLPDPVL